MEQALIKTFLSFLLFLNFFSLTGQVQKKNVRQSQQFWTHYIQHAQLADNWTLTTDGIYRWKTDPVQPAQYVLRTALSYQLKQPIRLSIGFGHIGFYQSESIRRLEFRPHQEVTISQKLGKVATKHRFRSEQRIFRGYEEGHMTNESLFYFRLRYLFSMKVPIWNIEADRTLFFSLADEVNLNAGKEIVYNHFGRNRLMIGPGLQWNSHWTVKLTYSQQFTAVNAPASYKSDQIIWIGLVHKMDWRNANERI